MRRGDGLALVLAAGAAAALLAAGPGMAEDAAGQVAVRPAPPGAYTPADPNMIAVADRGNDRIQVFWPNGTFAFKFGFEFDNHYRRAADLAVGPDGRIFVANYDTSDVTVFHPDGSYAFLLGHSGGALGQFAGPYAVAVGPDGRIVVSDSDGSDGRIQVFRPNGEFELAFNYDGYIYNHAHDVAVGPNGRIFVGGGGSDGVFTVFHPNGSLAADFDPPGRNYGNLIDVGPDGSVVVIARLDGDDGVYVLHPNGSHVMTGQVLHPNGSLAADGRPVRLDDLLPPGPIDFAVGSDGQIVVSSRYNHTVRVFHPNGSLALAFGSYGTLRDGFDSPTDVAVGPDGQIVVAEPGTRSIQVFHPNGSLAAEFGSRGAADGKFYTPSIVDVGPDGQIVVGDTAKRRIQVFHPAPNGSSYAFDGVAFGSHGLGERQFSSLADVAVGPDGMIVAADSDSGRVRAFHPNGSLALRLDHGAGFPISVAVGPDGQIVVGGIVWDEYHEYRSNVISVLHPYTHPNGSLAFRPSLPNGSLTIGPPIHLDSAASMSVAVAPNGRIIVGMGGLVHVFNPDGTLAFDRHVDISIARIAVGPDGRLVAVDTDRKLVHAFHPDGSFALSLLPSLRDGQFNGPIAVAVGPLSIPASVGPPAPLVAVIGQPLFTGGAGGVPHNFTNVGDSANVSIDVGGLVNPGAPPLNGSETSTVTFPATETVVAASFATVSFPPNVTATHVPAGGLLALHVSANVPDDGLVLEALAPNGSGAVVLRSVVEVGGQNSSVVFDRPVRILLEGQAGGRAFYIAGANGMITPVDEACMADGAAEVHAQLGGSGECQMDSVSGGKIVYTYHLTRFGTAEIVPVPAPAAPPPPPPVVHICSVSLGSANLDLRATAGGYSDPVRQALRNTGSLALEHIELGATTWKDIGPRPAPDPAPSIPPPVVGTDTGRTSAVLTAVLVGGLPASVTELSTDARGAAPYAPLANGTAVAHGLEGGDEEPIWFRMNLSDHSDMQGGTFVQTITYQAQCAPP